MLEGYIQRRGKKAAQPWLTFGSLEWQSQSYRVISHHTSTVSNQKEDVPRAHTSWVKAPKATEAHESQLTRAKTCLTSRYTEDNGVILD